MTAEPGLRLALDQNFPVSLLRAIRTYLPSEILVNSLYEIDPRLSDLDDRPLIIALYQMGWHGLITNNYKMLNVAEEIAAMVKTKVVVVAIESRGHDPLRAAGALLLELPGLIGRVRPGKSNIFLLRYAQRPPREAWKYFQRAAERLHRPADSLWQEVGVTDEELARPVLDEP